MSCTEPRTWKQSVLTVIVVFMLGAFVGTVSTAALSSRASKLFLLMTRLSFKSEEEARFGEAFRREDHQAALLHAACALEVEAGTPKAFEPSRSLWHLSFPVMGFFATSDTRYPVGDNTNLQALAHARMAVAWERLGSRGDAAKEYAEAARLSGVNDSEKWRRIVLATFEAHPKSP